ncbi:MAG: hypothetical protein Q8K75_07530 [Chlamydiales bacterium]|nr:hypothetical protein [Chlamydiales bacterium]
MYIVDGIRDYLFGKPATVIMPTYSRPPPSATATFSSKVVAKVDTVGQEALPNKILSESIIIDDIGQDRIKSAEENDRNLFIHYQKCVPGDLKKRDPKGIRCAVQHCITRSKVEGLPDNEKYDIRTFLMDKLAPLSSGQFNRSWLGGHDALQRILSPELDQLLKAQEVDESLQNDNNHQLELALCRAQLAITMGANPSKAGGCNGAVILKSLEGNAVGVFKVAPERGFFSDPIGKAKDFVGQARLMNRADPNNEPYSEVAMHYFSDIFGFDLAPPATEATFNGKTGAFLLFLGGYQEMSDVISRLEDRNDYTQAELIKWQITVLAIFLSLNFDPHSGNIFVKLDENKHIVDIKLIDAGNSFAERLPTWGSKGHRAEPARFKISREPWQPEVLEFIQNRLTMKRFDEFVSRVKADHPTFWTDKMDTLHRAGFDVVSHSVGEKIASPRELLQLLTWANYKKYMPEEQPCLHMDDTDFVVVDPTIDTDQKAA